MHIETLQDHDDCLSQCTYLRLYSLSGFQISGSGASACRGKRNHIKELKKIKKKKMAAWLIALLLATANGTRQREVVALIKAMATPLLSFAHCEVAATVTSHLITDGTLTTHSIRSAIF